MNNLNAIYKRILEVLHKISKEQLLHYQRRKPQLSDLELISLCLTAEYLGIDSENDLFRKLPGEKCFDNSTFIFKSDNTIEYIQYGCYDEYNPICDINPNPYTNFEWTRINKDSIKPVVHLG